MAVGLTAQRGATVGLGVRAVLVVCGLTVILAACSPSPAPTAERDPMPYAVFTPVATMDKPAPPNPPTPTGPIATSAFPPTAAPTIPPTIDVAPTQTRAAELAQIATFTAPTVTPTATATPEPPTATPTATAIPPTATATPIPATPTPNQALIAGHRQWFVTERRVILGSGADDVTGDGTPDYLYRSSGEGCGSCHGTWVTVFAGNQLIFDKGIFNDGTVAVAPDHLGFVVTESVVNPGESFSNASGRIHYTYRYAAGTFSLTKRQEIGVIAWPPTATPLPALTPAQYKTAATQQIDAMFYALYDVCPEGRCGLYGWASYQSGYTKYAAAWQGLNALGGATLPPQCSALHSSLMQLASVANGHASNGLAKARAQRNDFQSDINSAGTAIIAMKRNVVVTPGTCQ